MIYEMEGPKFYDTERTAFIAEPAPGAEVIPLYRDTSDAANLLPADIPYLRQTLRFYGLPLGAELKTRLDKIRDVQAEYAPQLTGLQEAKSGAEMRDDADDVADIKAEYTALLQEMNQKIQAVPND